MNTLSRQVVFRVCLCVIALGLVYTVFIAMPKTKQLQRMQTQVEQRENAEELQQQYRQVLLDRQATQRQIESLEDRLEGLNAGQGSSAIPVRAVSRADFVHEVSRRIKDHRLNVVEDRLIENQRLGRLPAYLQHAKDKLMLWEVTMTGSYENVARLLDTLSRDPDVIPAGLSMEQLNLDSPTQRWTLRIWLL